MASETIEIFCSNVLQSAHKVRLITSDPQQNDHPSKKEKVKTTVKVSLVFAANPTKLEEIELISLFDISESLTMSSFLLKPHLTTEYI